MHFVAVAYADASLVATGRGAVATLGVEVEAHMSLVLRRRFDIVGACSSLCQACMNARMHA